MTAKFLAIFFDVCILVFVLELVRREKLTFRYAFIWIMVCCFGLFFACFDSFLFDLARLFGFELPSNFIFFTLMGIFVLVTLLMTIFLCQQNRRNDTLAQQIAMLKNKIDDNKQG